MWVFTKSGFYSVVRKPGCAPGELEVRARCKKDLEILKKQAGTMSKILTNAGTDYPFRIRMRREIWARFLADEAMNIDYAQVSRTKYSSGKVRASGGESTGTMSILTCGKHFCV